MDTEEIDQILEQTFADQRLSRNERRALKAVLDAEGPTARRLTLLRERAFHVARQRLVGSEAQAVLDWLEEVVKVVQPESKPPRTAQAYFSPGDDCARTIAGLLRSAVRQIDICVFTITDDRIADAILEARRRKVAVRILTDDEKTSDLGSDIERLRNSDIAVRVDRSPYHMHHKFAVFDARTLLTGSYNWTRAANESNMDNFIVTGDAGLVETFSAAFGRLWAKCEE